MQYPYLIQIETITTCQLNCKMCGKQMMTRAKGEMEWDLFCKIIEDCKNLPIQVIIPFINGDPLTDNRMMRMLKYIKSEIPEVNIGWYTNGIGLTAEIIVEMSEIGNVDVFNVSIHGGNRKTYEQVTDMSWDLMLKKLQLLTKTNKRLANPFKIYAHMCNFSLTRDSIDDFRALCESFGIECAVSCFSNFGGLISDEVGEQPFKDLDYKLCARSQHHMYVFWDGTITSCCFDVNGENTFGNVKSQSLKTIWESHKYQEFRRMHRENQYKEIAVCCDCNSNRFTG